MNNLGILASSEDPNKLADTVRGLIITFASLIIFFGAHLGFSVSIEQVTNFAGELGAAVGVIWTTYGLLKKVIIAIKNKTTTPAA